jgi:hypothetical protein
VTIVTVYNATYSTGDQTNFHHQQCTLSSHHQKHQQNTTAQPRWQFILDLQAWLEDKIKNNHEIFLGIDMNETYDPDTPSAPYHLVYKEGIPTLNISIMMGP